MGNSTDDEKFERLAHAIDPGSKLVRTWTLQGGVSARVVAFEFRGSNGRVKRLVFRQHGTVDIKQNAHVASHEFRLLQVLQSVGVHAPKPYYVDESAAIFSTPYVVVEFIEGQDGSDFEPVDVTSAMSQLAGCLANIHCVDCSEVDLSFLPEQRESIADILADRRTHLDETLHGTAHALKFGGRLRRGNRRTLVHGDFWPGNTLWRDERLLAVIDWEDAAVGDPLSDFANGRLEVLCRFGVDAMHDFTRQYQSKMTAIDFTDLPFWDIYAALQLTANIPKWGLDGATEQRMRDKHRWFVSQAFDKLSLHDD